MADTYKIDIANLISLKNTIQGKLERTRELIDCSDKAIDSLGSNFSFVRKTFLDDSGAILVGDFEKLNISIDGALEHALLSEEGSIKSIEQIKDIEAIKNYKGIPQVRPYCTNISSAMMINRHRAIHGKDPNVPWQEAYGTGKWIGTKKTVRGDVYNLKKIVEYKGKDNRVYGVSKLLGENRQLGLISLLSQHPEGVVIHCNYYNSENSEGKAIGEHAILLTGYEGGHFKCIDPSSVAWGKNKTGEINLEDSWLYKGQGSSGNHEYKDVNHLLGSIKNIMYIDN